MPETASILVWIVVAILLAGAMGGVLAVRKERETPTSYTRRVPEGELAWWAQLPTETQEEMDAAALDLGEQAEIDARWDAAEAAGEASARLAEAAKRNALFHP